MYCMIEIAFDKKNEVNEAVNSLLYKKLAASCQVLESNSTWNWLGTRESSKEYLLHIKTKKSLINQIYQDIKRIHSYDTFEFAIYDITSPSEEYLDWINEETRS